MNQNRKEELLTRWLDEALSEAECRELEPILAEHPEMEREREEFLKMRAELREALPAEQEPPYPDFFNARLERVVRDSMRKTAGTEGLASAWKRMIGWWLAPAAVGALVLAFLAGMKIGRPQDGQVIAGPSAPPSAYSPLVDVTAEAHMDYILDATVIVMEGLDGITDQELIGVVEPEGGTKHFVVTASHTY